MYVRMCNTLEVLYLRYGLGPRGSSKSVLLRGKWGLLCRYIGVTPIIFESSCSSSCQLG